MERRDPNRRPQQYRGSPHLNRSPRKKKQFIKKNRDVVILDVLSHGHLGGDKPSWAKTPISQVLTFPDFVLYEVKISKGPKVIQPEEKKPYEDFLRENKIREVIKKIDYNDLTNTSKALIQPILEREIINYEEVFINFFNNSTSITPRMHALKLLPGIGKKHMWEIIETRQKAKFVTFKDIADRTSISNPAKQLAQRIIKELQRDVKYYIFSKTQKYE